jgi:hypothetical protein
VFDCSRPTSLMPSLDPAVQTGLHCHNQDPVTVGFDSVWKERGRLGLSSLLMLLASDLIWVGLVCSNKENQTQKVIDLTVLALSLFSKNILYLFSWVLTWNILIHIYILELGVCKCAEGERGVQKVYILSEHVMVKSHVWYGEEKGNGLVSVTDKVV